MGSNDVLAMPAVLRRDEIYRGKRINVEKVTIRLPDGREAVREVVRHPGAVVILAIDGGGRVVFVRNVRVAVGRVLLELPAGTLDPGESPEACAARELREETGYSAGRLEKLTEFFTSPGILDERIIAYVARELRAGSNDLDAGEQIEVELADYAAAVEMCLDGRIDDAKTLATILTYHLRTQQ